MRALPVAKYMETLQMCSKLSCKSISGTYWIKTTSACMLCGIDKSNASIKMCVCLLNCLGVYKFVSATQTLQVRCLLMFL